LGGRFINASGALRGEGAKSRLQFRVIASEAKQSIFSLRGAMDCFASLAMTAGTLESRSLSSGAHSREPLARNDGRAGELTL